mmetsp:Transcript_22495/g.56415  ORF Transcript_22495/g.56415 Transcript_22495/m.56415 type:complete len:252 (+) Transcript_22495:2167-2922(+)
MRRSRWERAARAALCASEMAFLSFLSWNPFAALLYWLNRPSYSLCSPTSSSYTRGNTNWRDRHILARWSACGSPNSSGVNRRQNDSHSVILSSKSTSESRGDCVGRVMLLGLRVRLKAPCFLSSFTLLATLYSGNSFTRAAPSLATNPLKQLEQNLKGSSMSTRKVAALGKLRSCSPCLWKSAREYTDSTVFRSLILENRMCSRTNNVVSSSKRIVMNGFSDRFSATTSPKAAFRTSCVRSLHSITSSMTE